MDHNDYMTGAELQALREACGLDRDQFGEMCGVKGAQREVLGDAQREVLGDAQRRTG